MLYFETALGEFGGTTKEFPKDRLGHFPLILAKLSFIGHMSAAKVGASERL
jgi:hypothetical protein